MYLQAELKTVDLELFSNQDISEFSMVKMNKGTPELIIIFRPK